VFIDAVDKGPCWNTGMGPCAGATRAWGPAGTRLKNVLLWPTKNVSSVSLRYTVLEIVGRPRFGAAASMASGPLDPSARAIEELFRMCVKLPAATYWFVGPVLKVDTVSALLQILGAVQI
jgi:hypothetical protein